MGSLSWESARIALLSLPGSGPFLLIKPINLQYHRLDYVTFSGSSAHLRGQKADISAQLRQRLCRQYSNVWYQDSLVSRLSGDSCFCTANPVNRYPGCWIDGLEEVSY